MYKIKCTPSNRIPNDIQLRSWEHNTNTIEPTNTIGNIILLVFDSKFDEQERPQKNLYLRAETS